MDCTSISDMHHATMPLSSWAATFYNNSASKLGGGLYSYFLDNTVGNSLTLSNSVFEENFSTNGYGGAYSLGFDHQTETNNCINNIIMVDACRFQDNTALYGGGLAFTSTQNHNQLKSNKMKHYKLHMDR